MSERHSSIACFLISEDLGWLRILEEPQRNRRKDIVCYLVIKDIGGLKILKEPIYETGKYGTFEKYPGALFAA